jgi:hypothetical protein
MKFPNASIFPDNQPKPVVTSAPYGLEWEPESFPDWTSR